MFDLDLSQRRLEALGSTWEHLGRLSKYLRPVIELEKGLKCCIVLDHSA